MQTSLYTFKPFYTLLKKNVLYWITALIISALSYKYQIGCQILLMKKKELSQETGDTIENESNLFFMDNSFYFLVKEYSIKSLVYH